MDRIIHYSLSPVSVSVSAFPDFDIERVKCFVFTSPQVPATSSQAVSLSQAINGVLICVLQPTLDTSLELTAALHDFYKELVSLAKFSTNVNMFFFKNRENFLAVFWEKMLIFNYIFLLFALVSN